MVKIIREGTKKSKKYECEECGCVFSYEKEDVRCIEDPNWYKTVETIHCPQCDNRIYLNIGIPKYLYKRRRI